MRSRRFDPMGLEDHPWRQNLSTQLIIQREKYQSTREIIHDLVYGSQDLGFIACHPKEKASF